MPGSTRWIQKCSPNDYHPSALQKFSKGSGYMICEPLYKAKWKMIKKREWPWVSTGKRVKDALGASMRAVQAFAGFAGGWGPCGAMGAPRAILCPLGRRDLTRDGTTSFGPRRRWSGEGLDGAAIASL